MIIILCEDYDQATNAYGWFLTTLPEWSIRRLFPHSNGVETDDGIRYIFIDQEYEGIFLHMTTDFMTLDEFLNGIPNLEYLF